MFGIDPLVLSSLLVLAGSGGTLCKIPKPAEISVIPRTEEIKYDYSRTVAEMQAESVDTINPFGFHGLSLTQGYMQGYVSVQPRVKLDYAQLPKYGAACLWYDRIDIELVIDPKIVIAREVYDDRCMRKAVIDHEMKHIRVDREVVNKYAKVMGKRVYDEIARRGGFIAGPVAYEDAEHVAGRMQKTVFQIIDHEFKKLDIERSERQQAVDSLEEYTGVSDLCPDFKYAPEALKGVRKGR